MKTLINTDSLQARISEMAMEIDSYYKQQDWYHNTQKPVVVIGVLTGAMFFVADLVRKLSIRVELDFIKVSTYPGKTTTAQESKIIIPPTRSLHNAHVLLVDDILDTGKTIKVVRKFLARWYPESMLTAVLLRKPGKASGNTMANFVGFNIEDEWVAGYGMDDSRGRRREVQCVFIDDD